MDDDLLPDETFRLYVDSDGVVRLCWTPGLIITGRLAAAAMAAVDELNGAVEQPLLVIMGGVGSPTPDARAAFGRGCTVSRIALLGESMVDRVRASFALPRDGGGVPVPTRFFTSEPQALVWLLGHSGDP